LLITICLNIAAKFGQLEQSVSNNNMINYLSANFSTAIGNINFISEL